MANIYDVNAAIDKPNILGAVQQGLQFGQQQRQQRMAEQDRQQVRNLAPQIIAGDPAAFSQAAAINPEAAGQFQQAGDSQVLRFKGFVDYIDKARATAQQTGDLRALNAALQQGAPYITQLTGKPAPTEWTADMEPGWDALKAKIALAGSGGTQGRVQSTYIDAQGQRVAIMADGTQKVLGGNDAGMSQQTITVTGPDGAPVQYTFDKRTGGYVPAQLGGPSSALGAPPDQGQPGMTQVQYATDDGSAIPPNEQAAAQAAFAAEARGQDFTIPVGGAQASGPSPFRGQTPAEKARAEADARNASDLAAYGQMTEQVAARETATTTARETAEAKAKSLAALPQVIAGADETVGLLDRVLNHPGRGAATGLSSANPLNRVPGTDAYDFNVLMDQIKGQAFLQAFQSLRGGGAITEREGQAATNAIARLNAAQSEQEFVNSITDLKRIVSGGRDRAILNASQGQQSNAPEQPSIQRARNPQTGQVLELRNGQWVPAG